MASSKAPNKSLPSLALKSTRTGGLLKEGLLFKRQRGRRATDLKGLKFQERFCALDFNILKYYSRKRDVGHKPSGTYQVGKIKIVEEVPEGTFTKHKRQQYTHFFQIGDENEVMYFGVSSKQDRDAWIETFRVLAFKLWKNEPLPFYHSGAYGHIDKNVWSCCKKEGRNAQGCVNSTTPSLERKFPLKQDSLSASDNEYTDSKKPLSRSLPEYAFNDQDSIGNAFLSSGDYSDSDIDDFVDTMEEQPATFPNKVFPSESQRKSMQSLDSGISVISAPNADSKSPGVSRSMKPSSWMERDRAPSSATILEETGSESRHSSDNFVYTHKTTIKLEESSSYVNTLFYQGVDRLVTATSNGNVCMSTLNSAELSKQTIFESKDNDAPLSVSIRKKSIAIGSDKLSFGKIDGTQVKNLKLLAVDNQNLGSPQLVTYGSAESTLYSASRGGNLVSVWNTSKHSTPTCTFKVANDGDEIFSLTASPKQSWLAVGVTSSKEPESDFVCIFDCENNFRLHDRIEIGYNSGVRVAFTHNGKHIFISRDVKIMCINLKNKFIDFSHTFKQDCSITSLTSSPVRNHLAVGLSTGEVKYFIGAPGHRNLVLSSVTAQNSEAKNNSAVTALAYSRDGMKVAVAHRNGTVQIWKGSKPPEEPALINAHSIPLTSKGLIIDLPEDGCRIVVPEGAVREGIKATLHYGVVPYSPFGPFEFEHTTRPVSTIISIRPEPINTEFLKPIEVTLPHFIACNSQKDCDRLFFSKARHDNFHVEKSKKIYHFEKINDGEISHLSQYDLQSKIPQGAAVLYTKHCCYICVTENISEEETSSKKVFSLQQIVPKDRDYNTNLVYYSLSYHLKTCVKTVDEQFPDELFEKCKKVVTFKDSHEKILKFCSEQLPGGWGLHLTNSGQIAENDLCFWDDDIFEDIEELCRNKHYPPKIPLRVRRGQEVMARGVSTRVSFTGVCSAYLYEREDVHFLLELTKPVVPSIELNVPSAGASPRRPQSFSSNTSHDSTSLVGSRALFISSVQDFQEQFYDIASNVDCKRLASAFLSESTPKKCSYLDEVARQTVRTFIDRAKCPTDNFETNFAILSDVMCIAENHSQYVSAIQAALNKIDPRGEIRSKKESISSASAVSFTTADESPLPVTPFQEENVMQSTPVTNGYLAPFSAESGPTFQEDNY